MLSLEQLHEELAQAEQLKQRWMGGQSAPLTDADLPASWRPILEGLEPEKRSLAALALLSQQQRLLIQLQPPEDVRSRPALPDLEHPPVPSSLRPILRRVLQRERLSSAVRTHGLLTFLWQRGYSAHPADWLPASNEKNVPDAYWPWQRWVAEDEARHSIGEPLSEDNWDDWYPAERLKKLYDLRQSDPNAARELMQTCAPREPADKRLPIVEVLQYGLSTSDVPYLEKLLKDRSSKVVQQASQFLARLEQRNDASDEFQEQAQELAEMYEWKSEGFFKKSRALVPLSFKKKRQREVRAGLLAYVPIASFAAALDCSASELLDHWDFSANRLHDNQQLIIQVANNLPDDVLPSLLDRLLVHFESHAHEVELLHDLAPRLSLEQKQAVLQHLFTHPKTDCRFSDVIPLYTGALPELSWEALQKSAVWKTLSEDITKSITDNVRVDSYYVEQDLAILGLLLPIDTAALALETLVGLGLMRADPCLDYLKLNAELSARC